MSKRRNSPVLRSESFILNSRSAFTLIEMVVVVAIITILVALVVPAAATLWNQRKLADAENTIQGLLMNAKAKAVEGDNGKYGLFFYLDADGVQQIRPIQQVTAEELLDSGLLNLDAKPFDNRMRVQQYHYDLILEHVYRIAEGRSGSLPAPIRAAPRYIVETPTGTETWQYFSDPEIGNNTFASLSSGTDNAQRHRNYFTMIFGTDGQLAVGEDVLIMDKNELQRSAAIGDVTGLPVGDDPSSTPVAPEVEKFYPRNHETGQQPQCIDPVRVGGTCQKVPLLIVDDKNIAINFPSVDGVLVYDDSLFVQFPTDKDKRAFLVRTGQPMYVSRHTGAVIRGPVGDVQ